MSGSDSVCPKCGKQCRDKRGVTIHLKKCGEIKEFICNACNAEFTAHHSLLVHYNRCKIIKQQHQEKEIAKQQESLKMDLLKQQEHIKEHMQQEQEKTLSIIQQKDNEIQSLKDKLKEIETIHRMDMKQSLKLRDDDVNALSQEVKSLSVELKVKSEAYEGLREQLEVAKHQIRFGQEQLKSLSSKENNMTMILNNNSNNTNQSLDLKCFEPSMIQGIIQPPERVIGTVTDLMNMMRRQGVRNCFRVNDKTRGTLTWNKPGKGLIRDPDGDLLSNHIVDSLQQDLQNERAFYENELTRLNNQSDPDPYYVNLAHEYISFCTRLLNREDSTIKKLKKLLVNQGKKRGDEQVDEIYNITYYKYINSIQLALFPKIHEWIDLSFYELGIYIGSKTKDRYKLEGASRESLYITIEDDDKYNRYRKQVKSNDLMEFFNEAVEQYMLEPNYKDIIYELLTNKTHLNQSNVKAMLDYIENPDIESTKQIMKGIVYL